MYAMDQIQRNLKGRQAMVSLGADGLAAIVNFRGVDLKMVFSFGMDWEHLSVSTESRCPTWAEMCFCKDIFFGPDDVCVQYHPRQSRYVNCHPNCLHIWRPQKEVVPEPPLCLV
jgi:hypothetical protein